MSESNSVSRRSFVLQGGAAVAAAVTSNPPPLAAQGRPRLRVAIVGTGGRGTGTWGKPVQDGYSDVV